MFKSSVALSYVFLLVACGSGSGASVTDSAPGSDSDGTGGSSVTSDDAESAEGVAESGGVPGLGGVIGGGGQPGTDAAIAGTGDTMAAGGRFDAGEATTPTGGATSVDGGACTSPLEASALVGWAAVSGSGVATTTGGGSATPTTASTLAELQAAVKGTSAAVVHVNGILAPGTLSIGSNKTIVGLCGAEIHGHVEMSGSVNVIVRNIKIVGHGVGSCALDPSYDPAVGCSSGEDAISVQKNAHHVWFDHCDVSDGTDGNLDITNGASYLTISWTKFHYTPRTDPTGNDSTGAAGHRYSNLIGGTDTPSGYDDANALNVTWHHNWWADNVMERQPRVRFGKNHVFNNLYSAAGNNYCVRAGIQAKLLIENNVFSGVKNPHVFNSTSDEGTASITADANAYLSTSGTKATGGGGTPFGAPPYAYTADAVSNLQAAIQAGAGPQ
jgi:pectate lyase